MSAGRKNVPRGTSETGVPLNDPFSPFFAGCARLGIPLSPEQRARFERYHAELLRWAGRVRLVSPNDLQRLPARHFLDSVLPLHLTTIPHAADVMDVGSGAGFPGIPIHLCRPDLHLTLVESNRKKSLFLRHLIDTLPLPTATVLLERVEALAGNPVYREAFDVALVRAVGPLGELLPSIVPLLKPGGCLIAYKGPDPSQELADAQERLSRWSGVIERVVPVSLPELPITSTIVVVRKTVTSDK